MFHSTTILESAVYITCFYLSFSVLDRNYFGQPEFMRKWKISPATAMDIACKVISAGFAMSATLCGIFILLISPSYTPSTNQDRSSFLVDRVMVWATSYFIYDFFAMFHVYLARKQEKSDANSFCSDPTLSQTLNSNNTDAKSSCTDLGLFQAWCSNIGCANLHPCTLCSTVPVSNLQTLKFFLLTHILSGSNTPDLDVKYFT